MKGLLLLNFSWSAFFIAQSDNLFLLHWQWFFEMIRETCMKSLNCFIQRIFFAFLKSCISEWGKQMSVSVHWRCVRLRSIIRRVIRRVRRYMCPWVESWSLWIVDWIRRVKCAKTSRFRTLSNVANGRGESGISWMALGLLHFLKYNFRSVWNLLSSLKVSFSD